MPLLEAIIGGVSSLAGLFGAAEQERKFRRAQEEALRHMAQQNDELYQSTLGNNSRNLLQMAGLGGDAIHQLGSQLGSDYAAAGLYNPSAVAGGLNIAAHNEQGTLADLAARLQANALQQRQQGQQQIGNLQFGLSRDMYGNAANNLNMGIGGLSSFLGNLTQNNLATSGANLGRTAVPAMNGTQNQGANLPGVAPAYKLPGLGDYGAGTTAGAAMNQLGGLPPAFGQQNATLGGFMPRKRGYVNPYASY